MDDPFLKLGRPPRRAPSAPPFLVESGAGDRPSKGHAERAHSKYSASGAERWFCCPGSVALSEGLPDKQNIYSEEGSRAHEVLEALMRIELSGNCGATIEECWPVVQRAEVAHPEMVRYAKRTRDFIFGLLKKHPGAEVTAEERIYLSFIHPEMFGTYDAAVVDHFGTLHVIDFKYGAGVFVSPKGNLQMLFYAIGVAHKYDWNFKRVRMWIDQPRVKGYDGPLFWEISILELKEKVEAFRGAVHRVLTEPQGFTEGSWCHWCRAKAICPRKLEKKAEAAKCLFTLMPYSS